MAAAKLAYSYKASTHLLQLRLQPLCSALNLTGPHSSSAETNMSRPSNCLCMNIGSVFLLPHESLMQDADTMLMESSIRVIEER